MVINILYIYICKLHKLRKVRYYTRHEFIMYIMAMLIYQGYTKHFKTIDFRINVKTNTVNALIRN